MHLSFEQRDALSALSLYMSARRTAIRAAQTIRTPMSTEQAEDLRIHYSSYFLNLLAAVDLFVEKGSPLPPGFEARLGSALVFSDHPDGKANLGYLRELRNAVVHRGLNIAAAAHAPDNVPLIIAPKTLATRSKSTPFDRFAFYVADLVVKCESVMPAAMLDHLEASGILELNVDPALAYVETIMSISQSDAMPDWVKANAVTSITPQHLEDAQRSVTAALRVTLSPIADLRSTI